MERYWYRKGYDLELQLKLNPFIENKKRKPSIDATSDDGLDSLSNLIPVKEI